MQLSDAIQGVDHAIGSIDALGRCQPAEKTARLDRARRLLAKGLRLLRAELVREEPSPADAENSLDRMNDKLTAIETTRDSDDYPGQTDEHRRQIIVESAIAAADELVMEGQ